MLIVWTKPTHFQEGPEETWTWLTEEPMAASVPVDFHLFLKTKAERIKETLGTRSPSENPQNSVICWPLKVSYSLGDETVLG